MRGSRWMAVALAAVVSFIPTAALAAPMVVKAKTVRTGGAGTPRRHMCLHQER